MQNTPILRPEVRREMASAMCRPMRSWRTMIGRMSAARGELDQVVDRIAEEDLDALALQDLRDRFAHFHLPAPFRPARKPRGCYGPSRSEPGFGASPTRLWRTVDTPKS